MATYNGEKYVVEQMRSILKQLTHDDEVVVVDDFSTDNTVRLLQDLNDPRIKLYLNDRNRKCVFSFGRAISLAKNDIIFLSDQDDVWEKNKVNIMTKYLNKYDMVISDAILIDATDAVIDNSFYKLRNSGPGFLKNLYKNSYLGCCMAFNRTILKKALPFPANVPMHDVWLGMIAELYSITYFCNEKLVYFRRHTSNASPTGNKSPYSIYKKIIFRYHLLYQLAKRYVTLRMHNTW